VRTVTAPLAASTCMNQRTKGAIEGMKGQSCARQQAGLKRAQLLPQTAVAANTDPSHLHQPACRHVAAMAGVGESQET
jgi:hypothetical protein